VLGQTICEQELVLGKCCGNSHAMELVFVNFVDVFLSS